MLRSHDLPAVYHRYLQYLTNSLPLRAVWLDFAGLDWADSDGENISFVNDGDPTSIPGIEDWLRSKPWLDTDWQTCPLIELSIVKGYWIYGLIIGNGNQGKQVNTHEARSHQILPCYLILCLEQSLSQEQQDELIEKRALFLDYLTICQENKQQKQQINLLKQVISQGEHKLRNYLGLINLYAENLFLGLTNNPLQAQAVVIKNAIQELTFNFQDLLKYSQPRNSNITIFDFSKLFLECLELLQNQIDSKQLQVEYPVNSFVLNGDKWQIKQVIENLLSNAIYFSPEGGKISCKWQIFHQEVLIEITDQGSGMSPETLKKAFTPFYSQREGGTGLGLTIAQQIVVEHHGQIWAENLMNGGAQFSVILPRSIN